MALREDDPESVGGYRIESRIGTGGMGVVYLGRSTSGRAVAVKVVHLQYAGHPEFRARFRQEVAAARRVSGAFTAPVVDADPDAERPWMATAYVAGDTLAQRVTESGPLAWPQLRRLGVELAEALREIHRAEVVHRDLKPSNVLLLDPGVGEPGGNGDDGAVRVIDFGISRAAQSDVRTQTGLVMGSPPFMAPEQFSTPREVGPAVDVFSLGALLVYAATGRSPFEAENAYLAAYQTVHNAPVLGGLPGQLRPLVLACLAKAPGDRPTPREVLETLARLPDALPAAPRGTERRAGAAATPVDACGPAPSAAAPPPASARRRWVRPVAASAVALSLATAVFLVTGTSDSDFGAAGPNAGSRSAPEGWKPWHTAFANNPVDGPSMTSCTPDAQGVFCSSDRTALLRLDSATGRTSWKKPMRRSKQSNGISVTSPVVGRGLVYGYSADGSQGVDAFGAADGRRRWHFKGPVSEFSYLSGVLLVHEGELGPTDTVTYSALNPKTGKRLWRRTLTTSSPSPFYAGPDGTLVADLRHRPTRDAAAKQRAEKRKSTNEAGKPGGTGESLSDRKTASQIVRLNARSGRIVHRIEAPKGDLWLAAVHDGNAYYARWENDSGVSAALYIQNLTSGRTRHIGLPWAVEPESPPLVAGDTMYFFDYGNETILALDLKRGRPRWTSERELRIFGEPAVFGNRLYVAMPDTSVQVLDAGTGKRLWRTEASFDTRNKSFADLSPTGVAPLVVGDVLYGVTDQGAFSVSAVSPDGREGTAGEDGNRGSTPSRTAP
ncbi:serine/threonine-protein kinase [Streptomyces sp. H27-D2]|uniref:serine/threonine-protein kinase n=1 Tax=Streptomyces sp. H27-D2 TaxID=3046304 RepID=UPI002DBACA5A|nr:serine/threonine-protein kinase [Streptomyces sp. H27-D2]MEC4019458.1 serine/threonine-protein kinase [Streptomyces sp. H27-D2]